MAANLANRLATAVVTVMPDTSGFEDPLKSGLDTAFGSVALSIGQTMEAVGKKLFKAFSIPLGIAMAANITQFQALNREINTVLTLFGTAPRMVERTFDDMAAGVRGVSEEVGGLERNISEGLYQAISASVPRDSVFEFLEVAQMAAMADKTADLTTAVDGISTAVNAFATEGLDAAEAADILFAGVAVGKTTFGELGQTIGRSAGLAANAGVQFSEFVAVISQMTKSGLQTSEAVSFLRAAITGLLRPSDDLNQIFQQIGFRTAEAAVPAIGLANAMEVVVQATGGSTSKLQELIGSSEAVTAVLAVTGENADAFAQTLNTVQNAAGSTSRAFDIMETGTGRSFGRMTEAFDRLGNTLGSIGAEIVVPFIDAITGVVTVLSHAFEPLIGAARTAGDVLAKMLSVFEVPIVQQFAAGVLAIALSLGALLGVLGLILVPLGKLVQIIATGRILSVFATGFLQIKAAVKGFVSTMEAAALAQTRWGATIVHMLAPVRALKTSLVGLGLATGAATAAAIGAFIGLAAAVAGAVVVFGKWKAAAEEAARANDIFGEGVSVMLENAEIVERTIPVVQQSMLDGAKASVIANLELIQQLRSVRDELGSLAAQEFLLNIGFQAVWRGATPEEALNQITGIAEHAGIEIPVSLGEFAAGTESIEASFASIEIQAQNIADIIESSGRRGAWRNASEDAARLGSQLGFVLAKAIELGERDLFDTMLGDLDEQITNTAVLRDILTDTIHSLEEASGRKLGFSLTKDTRSVEDFIDALNTLGLVVEETSKEKIEFEIPEFKLPGMPSVDEARERVNKLRGAGDDLLSITGEQRRVLNGLLEDAGAVFDQASAQLDEAIAKIREGFESQIPGLEKYKQFTEDAGAILRSNFESMSEDVDKITSNWDLVTTTLTPAGMEWFDNQGIAEQAAILTGSIDDIKANLESVNDLGAVTDPLEDLKIGAEIPGIMEQLNTDIEVGLSGLAAKAGTGGSSVAIEFNNALRTGAGSWPTEAQTWFDKVAAVTDQEIKGPTVTAPTFIGGKTTYTVYVRARTVSTRGSLQRGGHQP